MANIHHSAVLTAEEHAGVPPHREITKRIPVVRSSDWKVLDWGCGRGNDVMHFRRQGLEAYGVEPSMDTIERGRGLFEAAGLNQADIIKQLSADNTTAFASHTFDFLTSYYALEHVECIESAAHEMFRIMKPGATAVHLYPGHLHLIEGHLYMPLVHWLPKNHLRYFAIRAWTQLGIEPRWSELSGSSASAKARVYYAYSCNETFYRSPKVMAAAFRKAGFEVAFESHKHVRIQRLRLAKVIPDLLLNWLLCTFVGCVLVCRKPMR